jgi:predicted ATPase
VRAESTLVGRRWERSALEGLSDRAIDGYGSVVALVGPPGIGKSRLVREVATMAGDRDVEVFTAFCESHTNQVPFFSPLGVRVDKGLIAFQHRFFDDADDDAYDPTEFIDEDDEF